MSVDDRPTAILSRTIYLSLVVAAISFVVFEWQPLQWYGMAGTMVFLGLEVRRVPLFQSLMAAVLVSAGIIIGVVFGGAGPVDIVLRGIGKAQIFLVLFSRSSGCKRPRVLVQHYTRCDVPWFPSHRDAGSSIWLPVAIFSAPS